MTDILNTAVEAFIVLSDVTMDEWGSTASPVRADFAQVDLASVLFAVADEAILTGPTSARMAAFGASSGSLVAMNQAEAVLDKADQVQVSPERRNRVNELQEALFQTIQMQLNSQLQRGQPGRGTSHNTIDVPMNDRLWLKSQFKLIRAMDSEVDRIKAISALINRTDPGPGGFYDDLGDPSRQPHLVPSSVPFAENPDFRKSTFTGFDYRPDRPGNGGRT